MRTVIVPNFFAKFTQFLLIQPVFGEIYLTTVLWCIQLLHFYCPYLDDITCHQTCIDLVKLCVLPFFQPILVCLLLIYLLLFILCECEAENKLENCQKKNVGRPLSLSRQKRSEDSMKVNWLQEFGQRVWAVLSDEIFSIKLFRSMDFSTMLVSTLRQTKIPAWDLVKRFIGKKLANYKTW